MTGDGAHKTEPKIHDAKKNSAIITHTKSGFMGMIFLWGKMFCYKFRNLTNGCQLDDGFGRCNFSPASKMASSMLN